MRRLKAQPPGEERRVCRSDASDGPCDVKPFGRDGFHFGQCSFTDLKIEGHDLLVPRQLDLKARTHKRLDGIA